PHTVKVNQEALLRLVHHQPVCCTRPVRSALPSPLKSPTRTSTQVTAVGHWTHLVKLNGAPLLTRHQPVCSTRPVTSALPSPSKSPTLTSTQVTVVGHWPHLEKLNELPLLMLIHH